MPMPPTGREITALLLLVPSKEFIAVTLREGEDFWDDLDEEFGDFYILETGDREMQSRLNAGVELIMDDLETEATSGSNS